MALEDANVVDAAGIEKDTGFIILTMADAWDWTDEQMHLKALQAKFNGYIRFIESGEILDTFPEAAFKQIVIHLVCRLPLPLIGQDLLKYASGVCEKIGVQVRHTVYPGSLMTGQVF